MAQREADVKGVQRKVVSCSVRPARAAYGDAGIALQAGTTRPFVVTREWSAPAGHYVESWYLINPETREVLFEAPQREVSIWGLQSLSEITDVVEDPIALEPGTYGLVFALNRVLGGEFEVEASEATTEAA